MANTLKLGAGKWATGKDTVLSFNDENGNFKPLPFDFSRASSATVVNQSGLIETVGSGTPRIDFLGNTKGALLLEPTRSNLITYSENFSQWQQSGVSITPNSAISPDGTLNADKIIATTTDPAPFIFANVTATEHTFSFYYKGEGNSIGKQARVLFWFIGTATGTTTSVNFIVTGDWQRFENQITPTGAGTLALRIDFPADLGAVGDYGYLWGAQLEAGSYATSYIPTSGQSGGVTRVVDKCISAGNNQVIKSTEGTIYAEQKSLETNFTYNYFVAVSDGTNNNRLEIRQTATGLQFLWRVGGTYQSQIVLTNAPFTSVIKFALRYSSANIKFYVNGSLVGTLNSPTLYASGVLKNIEFADGSGGTNFRGTVKDLKYYNTALSDAELAALTTI